MNQRSLDSSFFFSFVPLLIKPKDSSIFLVFSVASSNRDKSIFRFKYSLRADKACCAAFASG